MRPRLDPGAQFFAQVRRAQVWARKDEFWALYFSAIRAYEEWERAAIPPEPIRRTVAVLSIASGAFWKGVA